MQDSNELTQLLLKTAELMQLDNPIGHRNLTLVPIKGGSAELDYVLASEAIGDGTLTVKEISESGAVNTLAVENKGSKRVLLLDGEELIGAKQNRILNTTILVEANSTQKIPVSCVEQGRWRHASSNFSMGKYAPPEMRRSKSQFISHSYARCGEAISNQNQVWQDVEKLCLDLHADAPTRAMNDVFDQWAEEFDSYVQALPYPKDACGVAAAIGGQFVAIDVLDRADTFEKIWNRLISGYAMDAVRQRHGESKPFTDKNVRFFLDCLSECQFQSFAAVGLGTELRFQSSQVLGQALAVEYTILNMSVFPNSLQNRPECDREGHIMPPSFRRRPRGIE